MTMRSDMAGAAVVLGIMRVLVQLQLPLNVSVVIAAAENGIGSQSFKLGDVYMSMEGLSVEIANTDAEGRLLLADAFTYARRRLQPTEMIDIATLTGAVVNALGGAASGLFTDDDRLAELLWQAGELTGERLCRLPLYEEYEEEL